MCKTVNHKLNVALGRSESTPVSNAHGIKEPQKVFDEGYTTKSFGSGLGLWICKKYIESMGGELKLERSSEDFTEFTIRL